MPGKHRESRNCTTDETCRLAARTSQPKRARRGRYWFPHSFFDPIHFNATEAEAVEANQPALNTLADQVEALTKELGIPVAIRGGMVSLGQRTIGFVIDCDPAIRTNIPAHREFIRRLKAAYPCRIAGMDRDNDVIWLKEITLQRQNTFAIMTAEGGHA